jgi:hypothetical protein
MTSRSRDGPGPILTISNYIGKSNSTEILDEIVNVMAGYWSRCCRLPGFSEVVVEATTSSAMQTKKLKVNAGEVANSSLESKS